MVRLVFPDYPFRSREARGRREIFDTARRRWVAFTPEEWVRQNFVQYLLQTKAYPASLIAIEKELLLGELTKRFDILVYDHLHQPWLMVECKSADIVLNDAVVHQLLRYNIAIPVPYLAISNGNSNYFFKRQNGKLEAVGELPDWGS